MALKTTFVVQTFVLKRKRLTPGDREVAPTESGALKKAEAMAAPARHRGPQGRCRRRGRGTSKPRRSWRSSATYRTTSPKV